MLMELSIILHHCWVIVEYSNLMWNLLLATNQAKSNWMRPSSIDWWTAHIIVQIWLGWHKPWRIWTIGCGWWWIEWRNKTSGSWNWPWRVLLMLAEFLMMMIGGQQFFIGNCGVFIISSYSSIAFIVNKIVVYNYCPFLNFIAFLQGMLHFSADFEAFLCS